MPPSVVPYDPPARSRSRAQSRISTLLEAAEHLAEDVEEVGAAAVRVTRVASKFGHDYEEAYPDGWLSQPVGGGTSDGRSRSQRRGEPEEAVEQSRRPSSTRWSGRTMVVEESEPPALRKSRPRSKSQPYRQTDYDDAAVDTFRAALADAQEYVEEISSSAKRIRRLRQELTGAVYTRKLTRRHSKSRAKPFDAEQEDRLASLTTTVRKQVLLTFHTIYALKKQFPAFVSSPITSDNRKELKHDVNHLVESFADVLNFVEDLAEEEKKDLESGALDVRMEQYIRDAEPGLQDSEVFAELKAAKREAAEKGVEDLKLESFARRCALQRPFSEIDRSLQEIDLYENGFKSTKDVKHGTMGVLHRVVDRIEHVFHPDPKLPHSRFGTARSSNRLLELGHSKKPAASDSDDSDAELLGPDGQLPYHVPSDDPNGDQMTVEDQLEDARRKRRLERMALPWIVFEWVGIVALYLYWGISRGLGNENPLGNIDLGSHFGDDAWSDTSGAIPTATVSSFYATSSFNGTSAPASSADTTSASHIATTAVPGPSRGSSATTSPVPTQSTSAEPSAASSSDP